MSQINFTRKTFLEKEEIARLQEFLRDSPSENAIIGNTSKYGILRTDFENDTDFLVEPSSNAGRVKIAKQENKAITIDGNRIYQEAIDNIEVPDDNLWYWMRIKYKYVTYEKGTVSINSSGEVVGNGTSFLEVLRGQGTNVPTKVKFLKLDGTPAVNSGFYEVVDVLNNQNLILTSAVDFVAESDLRLVVLGTTPLGEMLSAEQQEGLYKYDSCEIEFIPEDVEDSETPPHLSMVNPDTTYEKDKMFYIARVKNNAGFVDVDNDNSNVRADFWEFNVVGLTDKLSKFSNLSDLSNVNAALSNLGFTTVGKNLAKANPVPQITYIRVNANGTVSFLQLPEFADGLNAYLKNFYLNRNNHLSDLLDVAQARTNLNVYSKTEIDEVTAIDLNSYVNPAVWKDFDCKIRIRGKLAELTFEGKPKATPQTYFFATNIPENIYGAFAPFDPAIPIGFIQYRMEGGTSYTTERVAISPPSTDFPGADIYIFSGPPAFIGNTLRARVNWMVQ